ncbi:uncharacterized protein [Watersipora subatra]|uniref:uncharacterized protein n=1 Tax=Watersipora subatra TaxID=2589382 RepID=UPI00355B4165
MFDDLLETQKEGGGEGTLHQTPSEFDAMFLHRYISQKVFKCDETGLFWKKLPRRTYITAEEKKLPGHKPMKDRLTLALCTNASGDLKIKPLLVYHSENLLLDNASAHPPGLKDNLRSDFFYQISLPATKHHPTPSAYEPQILKSSWKRLWPGVEANQDTEDSEKEVIIDPTSEGDVTEIVSLRMSMGLVVDEADIDNLIEEHREELTTEDLKELEAVHSNIVQGEPQFGGDEELEGTEKITSTEIKKTLSCYENLTK